MSDPRQYLGLTGEIQQLRAQFAEQARTLETLRAELRSARAAHVDDLRQFNERLDTFISQKP